MAMNIRRSYVDGGFGQIHVRVADAASPHRHPLYCLHQSPKCGWEFQRFMEVASAAGAIVAPDYPGYGASDPPPTQTDATIESYATEVWRVADTLGHARVDLFGNHTGAKVAAEMAVQRPQQVRAIIMVSAPLLTPQERARFADYFTPTPLDREGARFRLQWERVVAHAGPGVTLEMMARSYVQNLLGGEGYEWGHAAAFAYQAPFEAALRTLAHPIFVINPADDLQDATRRARPLLRNGRIIEAPHWGHGFLDAFAEDVAALVTSLLDSGAVGE
jgi:pimeloyl-ACP methyl ester carboxylesterase